MDINFERVGNLVLNVRKNDGEKFYSLESILEQSGKAPCALDKKQEPVKLDCRAIFGYRFNGYDFVQSVFIDKAGLQKIIRDRVS